MTEQKTLADIYEKLGTVEGKVDDAAVQRAEDRERLDAIDERLKIVESATDNSLWQWLLHHYKIVIALSLPVPIVLSVLATGLYSKYGDTAINFLRKEIEASVEAASTEILFQPEAHSFIRQPVYVGGMIEYVLIAGRTEYGRDCTYLDMIPIFLDEFGNRIIGDFEARGYQFSERLERREIDIPVPDDLRPGRVISILQIEYDCDGVEAFELTDPISFFLLPTPGSQ